MQLQARWASAFSLRSTLFPWIPWRTSDLFTLESAKRPKEMRMQPARFGLMTWCWRKLTSGHAVEANGDGGGLHREAAGQAAEHGLNGETSRFLTIDDRLLFQLYRVELDSALCKWKAAVDTILCCTGCLLARQSCFVPSSVSPLLSLQLSAARIQEWA